MEWITTGRVLLRGFTTNIIIIASLHQARGSAHRRPPACQKLKYILESISTVLRSLRLLRLKLLSHTRLLGSHDPMISGRSHTATFNSIRSLAIVSYLLSSTDDPFCGSIPDRRHRKRLEPPAACDHECWLLPRLLTSSMIYLSVCVDVAFVVVVVVGWGGYFYPG